jgi:hypothetical protein
MDTIEIYSLAISNKLMKLKGNNSPIHPWMETSTTHVVAIGRYQDFTIKRRLVLLSRWDYRRGFFHFSIPEEGDCPERCRIYFQPSSFNYHAITCFGEARSQLEAIHFLCCQSSFLQITNVSRQVEPSYQFSAPNTCPGKRYNSFIFR